MSEVVHMVRERLEGYPSSDDIVDALNDVRADERPSIVLAPPNWSPLFNGYTEACAILNMQPDHRFLSHPVEIPAETEWLGGSLLRLANSTVSPAVSSAYSFQSKEMSQRGICDEAEPNYIDALGMGGSYGLKKGKQRNIIYIDEESSPVFFRKGINVCSSLSLTDTTVNNVTHPAGTIMSVKLKTSIGEPLAKSRDAEVRYIEEIESVVPLRLSMMAIPPSERLDSLLTTRQKNYNLTEGALSLESRALLRMPTVRGIRRYLNGELVKLLLHHTKEDF